MNFANLLRRSFLAAAALALILAAAPCHATVLLELAGGYLKNENGTLATAGSGLLVLVASTSDSSFSSITASSGFTVGSALNLGSDDVVLYTSSISGDGYMDGVASAGEFRQVISLTLTATIAEGSALQLYWFPSLTSASTSATAGVYYGTYRSGVALGSSDADGSSAWFLPADGTSGYELLFLTSDAGSSVNTVSSGSALGSATNIVAVPEPAGWMLLIPGLSAVFMLRRSRSFS